MPVGNITQDAEQPRDQAKGDEIEQRGFLVSGFSGMKKLPSQPIKQSGSGIKNMAPAQVVDGDAADHRFRRQHYGHPEYTHRRAALVRQKTPKP